MRSLLLCAALALVLPGCFLARHTENEPLHADRIARLSPGTSTAKEAVELLGAPTDVIQLGKRTAYRYDFTMKKDAGIILLIVGLYNTDLRADRVWLFFDERDILTHVASSLHAADAHYAMPWQSVRGS